MIWNRRNVYNNITTGNAQAFGVSQSDFVILGDQRKEDVGRKLGEFSRLFSEDKRFRKKMENSSWGTGPV